MKHCPIKALSAEFPEQEVQSYRDEIEKEIDASLVFARNAAFPGKETIKA